MAHDESTNMGTPMIGLTPIWDKTSRYGPKTDTYTPGIEGFPPAINEYAFGNPVSPAYHSPSPQYQASPQYGMRVGSNQYISPVYSPTLQSPSYRPVVGSGLPNQISPAYIAEKSYSPY